MLRISLVLLAFILPGCASQVTGPCPDLTGRYRDTPGPERLTSVLGLKPASTVAIESSADHIQVKAGSAVRTFVAGTDYRCDAQGLHLQAPVTGGFDVPGVAAEHVDRYYTLSRDAHGALVGTSTERTRVRFILPELQSAGAPGPSSRWPAAS